MNVDTTHHLPTNSTAQSSRTAATAPTIVTARTSGGSSIRSTFASLAI